jgi:hypothetical protein
MPLCSAYWRNNIRPEELGNFTTTDIIAEQLTLTFSLDNNSRKKITSPERLRFGDGSARKLKAMARCN